MRDALRYLQNNVLRENVVKRPDRAEATRTANDPFPAVEEALVNAVYHRGYDRLGPVEVRVNPEGIDVVSYPGPDASIRIEALSGDKIVARRYRNRHILLRQGGPGRNEPPGGHTILLGRPDPSRALPGRSRATQ